MSTQYYKKIITNQLNKTLSGIYYIFIYFIFNFNFGFQKLTEGQMCLIQINRVEIEIF